MFLIAALRVLFSLLSLLVLAAAAYLLWRWFDGDPVLAADGVVRRVHHEWMLWTGIVLLAWSLLGRLPLRFLLAGADRDPTRPERGPGQQIASATGGSLYVETMGPADAPVIVLTHGWSLDSTIWFYAKRDLAKRFRVIVWDLPGLGKSHRNKRGSVSLPGFAQDLASVIATAGGRPVLLVGHSIGGMVTQTLARDRPELFGREVAGVVLLNTTYVNPLKTMIMSGLAQALRWPVVEPMMRLTTWLYPLSWAMAWQSYLSGSAHLSNRFGFGRFVTRSQLDHTALLTTRNSPSVMAHGDLAMFRWDSEMALARAGVPVLVVGGSMDILTKPSASEHIAASVPDAKLQIVDGVNHMGFLERADVYNAAIEKFADRVFGRPERASSHPS